MTFQQSETFYEGIARGSEGRGNIIYGAHGCRELCRMFASIRPYEQVSSLRTPIAEMIGKMCANLLTVYLEIRINNLSVDQLKSQDGADIRHMHADDC
jgi:hypothetical protein